MIRFELHLEGCTGPVLWEPPNHTSGNTTPSPPRVVIYAEKVWHFYRFRVPQIPGHRAATYRLCTVLRLAPGEYRPK